MQNNLRKNEKGFTLVELMVVVAIIGILSAVAIPNFRRYQSKSKMSEAKLALSAIYMAETSFMGDADTYATCLFDMGYVPAGSNKTEYDKDEGNSERYYNVGFTNKDSGITPSDDEINGITCHTTQFYYSGKKGNTSPNPPKSVDDPTHAKNTEFVAAAEGVISNDFTGSKCSLLTIDETKKITIERAGY